MNKIEGNKVYLRKMIESDTDNIIKWRNSSSVKKNFIDQNDFTPESHLKWLHSVVETGKAEQFIIIDKELEQPVGSVYFRDIDMKHKKAEFGIFIGEENARGKGFGTEVAKIFIQYGFNNLGLHRIFLRVLADNEQAIKSYEKSGFKYEGTMVDDVFINNQFVSIVRMAIVNKECEE